MNSLFEEIMELATKHGTVSIKNGIVYVQEANGTIWSFTIPQRERNPVAG